MPYAVETRDLTRIFAGKRHWLRKPDPEEVERGVGPTTALGGVTVQIPEGELFGLLGPNGAGKTTLIKILCTLLLPTSGEAFVAGHDVTKDVFPIRQRIGRDYVMKWLKENKGKTVLLTTHYMAEADEMCDRIAIIDNGKILACDTPENLKRTARMDTTFQLEVDALRNTDGFTAIPGVKNFSSKNDIGKNMTHLTFILDGEAPVADILSRIMSQGSKVHSLQKSEPTLEDVFIRMVGRGFE